MLPGTKHEMQASVAAESLDARAARLRTTGGWVLAIGSAAVVVTSGWYLSAPPAAIAPTLAIPMEAKAAAIEGAARMRWAGTSGILGNPVMAAAALLLGVSKVLRGRSLAAIGWCLITMSLVIFELVDGLVGFAVPIAAAQSDAAFATVRSLFSAYFLAGTALFGAGAMLAARDTMSAGGLLGWSSRVAVVDGLVGVVVGSVGLAGVSAPSLVGATIGVGALAFTCIGIGLAASARA